MPFSCNDRNSLPIPCQAPSPPLARRFWNWNETLAFISESHTLTLTEYPPWPGRPRMTSKKKGGHPGSADAIGHCARSASTADCHFQGSHWPRAVTTILIPKQEHYTNRHVPILQCTRVANTSRSVHWLLILGAPPASASFDRCRTIVREHRLRMESLLTCAPSKSRGPTTRFEP